MTHHHLLFTIAISISLLNGETRGRPTKVYTPDPYTMNQTARIGDNPFPTNPMSDRARGYLLQGKAQTAI
ncbi:uncharacterized protein METZ01_LOCUS140168, partial [marine metagenome]